MYISKVKSRGHPAVYRFSLNASLPAPWQIVSPGDGEVPSFQVSPGPHAVSCRYQGRGPSMPCWWALVTLGSARLKLLLAEKDCLPPSAGSAAGTGRGARARAAESARPGFNSGSAIYDLGVFGKMTLSL